MDPVLILSPDFPPRPGGVADHTVFLAAAFAKDSTVIVLTSTGAQSHPDYEVRPAIADWHDAGQLIAAVEAAPADALILWQYVPHMYGRGGVNSAVPAVMRHFRSQGRAQKVIGHEICMPWSLWPHRFHYAWAQRRQWRVIAECADLIGMSTEAWIDRWAARWPWLAPKMVLSPSPSNIPVVHCPSGHRDSWRGEHGLPRETPVMTFFGTLSAAKQFSWVESAWRRAQQKECPAALVVLGGKPSLTSGSAIEPMFKPLGRLPPEEISRAFQATDVLLLPFIDGTSERRTSFTAGLSHGLAIATTFGPSTGRSLRQERCFTATDVNDPDAFARSAAELLGNDARRAELGSAARKSYLQNYDWPVVIRRLRAVAPGNQASVRGSKPGADSH